MQRITCALLAAWIFTLGHSVAAEPFSVNDLLSLRRLSGSEVSPDGRWIAYTVREPQLEQNKFISHIWLIPADGGSPRQITNHEKGESNPKWSPDGKTISFLSSRGGSQQIWLLPLDGGEARQLTSLSTEADNQIWSPDGQSIAFTSEVWPDLPDDAAQKKRADEQESSGVKALVIDSLLHRHWNDWRRGKRSHIFVTPISTNAPVDVTPGDFEAPPFSLGGSHMFDFSPDGKSLAFTRGPARSVQAWSTDTSISITRLGPNAAIEDLTAPNKGWDGSPHFSPDGKSIAYRSQSRAGYEADKMRLALLDLATRQTTYLADSLDRSIEEILWSPDGKIIWFTVEEEGRFALYSITPQANAQATRLFVGSHFGGLSAPRDASFIAFSFDSLLRAPELGRLSLPAPEATWKQLTTLNDSVYQSRAQPTVESFRYPGALGASIQSWILKPPGFDPSRRYPCLLLIHGGPQTAFNDSFSFRWNTMTYAAHGYVVVAPNPHGSTGFGQAFTEQISGDWGGAVYEDVIKAADWAASQPFIDPQRIAAAGASYGGYMMNWIAGHTDRFKTLVCHAGVFNLESKYGATEELWFPEWEFKGVPWENPSLYQKFSPHRFAGNFRTPMLVTHGELDYRVPVDQSLQVFTVLQRRGIPSRLLIYPDEGHWILKLKNSRLYYNTVFEWLDRYLKPE